MTQTLGRLEKVDIKSVWKTEFNHFTPWLAREENINLLAEELKTDLEVIEMEKPVGPFRADILCKDTGTDNYVIIENQFGKTDHTHLGQIMTYASGLDAFTVIWIAESFTEEHRAALDWMNNITDENIEFFGIEIELFKIGDSYAAPKFNLVSKPNSWSKSIKKSSSSIQLTETKQLQQEYWQGLKDYVDTQKVSFRLQKALPQHWTNISIGKSDYKLCALANSRDRWIGIQLVVSGNNSLENFRRLRENYQPDSENKLSEKIEWVEKEGGKEHHVNLIFDNNNPLDKNLMKEQHQLLTEWIEKFYRYFKDKVKNN
ncbi:MAG: DUF4268 domain-containing protein [Cyclobacteriaceae bacterium]|nr:DUF4268 domain-containing protein [Cyclobacteriaceae bacterium]